MSPALAVSTVPVPMPAPAGVCEVVTEVWPQPDGSTLVDVTHRTDRVTDEFPPCFRDLFLAAVRDAARSAPLPGEIESTNGM